MNLSRKYEFIVFDLDDTLLDTWGQLVPKATRESCEAMVDAGLAAKVDHCVEERHRYIRQNPRGDVYTHLVQTFGVTGGADKARVAHAGSSAFLNRRVEKEIRLFEGTRELLRELNDKYKLFLVTAGSPETQQQKVTNLDLAAFFNGIHYVETRKGETKRQAFQRIMESQGATPQKFLSVGNRIDTDIAEAKILGWDTCWVRYGEYAHLLPESPLETPDYEITHIRELSNTCRL